YIHRSCYMHMRLGLLLYGWKCVMRPRLLYSILANPALVPLPLTGHSQGAITVNIAEADDEERERRRVHLREPYRTLLGHLRHEIAHYYWDQLISWTPRLNQFRQLFGNEEVNYNAARQTYYQLATPAHLQRQHISRAACTPPV